MSPAAGKLRLGPLPRTESVKLTISLSADLKQAIDDYAVAHSQVHGDMVDALTLIPHMLQAFIARDRGFKAIAKKRSASAASPPPAS